MCRPGDKLDAYENGQGRIAARDADRGFVRTGIKGINFLAMLASSVVFRVTMRPAARMDVRFETPAYCDVALVKVGLGDDGRLLGSIPRLVMLVS